MISRNRIAALSYLLAAGIIGGAIAVYIFLAPPLWVGGLAWGILAFLQFTKLI